MTNTTPQHHERLEAMHPTQNQLRAIDVVTDHTIAAFTNAADEEPSLAGLPRGEITSLLQTIITHTISLWIDTLQEPSP